MDNFKEHLQSYLDSENVDTLIASFSNKRKYGLILNDKKMSIEQFKKEFPLVKPHPYLPNGFIYDKDIYDFGKHIYHELGLYYISEPSAMVIPSVLDVKEDDVILDMCAAPGGKTISSSIIKNDKGLIIANDLAKDRALILLENVIRMGRSNILITNNDFSLIYKKFLNTFDKIILDAPCSGSGMFRKDEKMIKDWSYNKVMKYSMIQMELIDIAYAMLKPGGTMVYSTCSYSYEEDEAVIKHLLANSDAEILNNIIDKSLFQSKEKIGYHLFPHLFEGEGHYFAIVHKPGVSSKTKLTFINHRYPLLNSELDHYYVTSFNNVIFALNGTINFKGLNIIRFGLKVGEIFNKEIRYDLAYARFLKHCDKIVELDYDQAIKYIKGESININGNYNGYYLLSYSHLIIDCSKIVNNIIKNHYPKNMRKNIN